MRHFLTGLFAATETESGHGVGDTVGPGLGVGRVGLEDDIEDEEDEMDGDLVDYESTDSMTSANHLNGFMLATKTEKDPKIQFQIKRSSATSNAIFYNANCLSHQNSQQVWHYELCCIFANVSLLEPRHLFTCLSSSEPGLGTRLMF